LKANIAANIPSVGGFLSLSRFDDVRKALPVKDSDGFSTTRRIEHEFQQRSISHGHITSDGLSDPPAQNLVSGLCSRRTRLHSKQIQSCVFH
jgi:hypothetical protein